ncbi:hypothetical protein F4810DRAFT_456479 [Camillea tinctor]|nr:hypothetical protein F4810DRAFT_456479 [Camillea tinctor]
MYSYLHYTPSMFNNELASTYFSCSPHLLFLGTPSTITYFVLYEERWRFPLSFTYRSADLGLDLSTPQPGCVIVPMISCSLFGHIIFFHTPSQ